MSGNKYASGIITLVQEHRFKLEIAGGHHQLFVLAHDALQEWRDLHTLVTLGTSVTVRYTENDDLIASTAHAISVQ